MKKEPNKTEPDKATVRKVLVVAEEEGQKLLNFLQRRLKNVASGVPLPGALLHRLIRSGQVRVNGARAKPAQNLLAGDEVRIPPLGRVMLIATNALSEQIREISGVENVGSELASSTAISVPVSYAHCFAANYPETSVLYETSEYAVVNKPAGLPVHGGTNHADSLIARFHKCAGELPFLPTLAHRIDKSTSGIVLVAKTYKFLRFVQDSLKDGAAEKEYLAWVKGAWQGKGWQTLEDYLLKREEGEHAKIQKVSSVQRAENTDLQGTQHSLCEVRPLKIAPLLQGGCPATLLRIKLLTGRTHQIRVQLSSRGFPILGDVKYEGPQMLCGMLLHSWYFKLLAQGEALHLFKVLPAWSEPFSVDEGMIYGA